MMMLNALIIAGAVILLTGLLCFENKENWKLLTPTKALLSLLFILAALVQPHLMPRYYHLLLVGLVFCLCGDICLALPWKRMFLLGLVSFLIGHIFYILAFFHVGETGWWTWVGSLVALAISGSIYLWLKPHLGPMHGPVAVYIIIITIMLSGACSVLASTGLCEPARLMVFGGALCFYFSDLFVARDRFMKKEFLNRLIGLPMYYSGQFLLAFSVGFP
jgi:uncharacterized membrane protein YhhN